MRTIKAALILLVYSLMEKLIQYILVLHATVGGIALISGALSFLFKKGEQAHKKAGRIYFWMMTMVFITGIIIAGYRYNRFLFLIAFLSYYSVFCGIRALKLKRLHADQSAKWYDWMAGILNAAANLVFLGLGIAYLLVNNNMGGAMLSIGFSFVGLWISYTNLKPFVIKPKKHYEWYLSHIGNMTGGYIATTTAFLSTMVTRFQLVNPLLAFAIPTMIGIPLLIYWTKKIEKQFNKP